MMLNRQSIGAVVGAVALLLAGCAAPTSITAVPLEDAQLTDDIVFALRLSPQLHDIGFDGATEGYVLLAREDGSADLVNVGYMDTGQLIWNDGGLFFGGPATEYQLTKSGVKSRPRGTDEEYETSRFTKPRGDGFIAIYNSGFSANGYRNTVVDGDGSNLRHWNTSGMFTALAQCGDATVGITTSVELDVSTRAPIVARNDSDVLVQIAPQENDANNRVLGQVDRGGAYDYEQFMEKAPCVNRVMYVLAYKAPTDRPQDRMPVLRAWNTASGEHTEVPLLFKGDDGQSFTPDDTGLLQGHANTDFSYHWISLGDGKVWSVDLASGTVTRLPDVGLSHPQGESRAVVTEHAIFLLDVSADRTVLSFSRYDIATGAKTHYFDIRNLPSADRWHMHRNFIRSIAINPTWLDKHQ